MSDQNKILFAQRILDRLIFLYFLVEKGIIYKTQDGEKVDILTKPFFEYLVEKTEFYTSLSEIMFDFLNNENDSIFQLSQLTEFQFFIPYLNGGLFHINKIETNKGGFIRETEISIEDYNWSKLIKIFNQYNWIIDEFVSDENDTGNITPEILGSIYEKFVITITDLDELTFDKLEKYSFSATGIFKKGTKKAGAYYTPEHITHYMTEVSIFTKVSQNLDGNKKYSNFDEFFMNNRDNKQKLLEFNKELLLMNFLDPAVGSGAFLLACANLIFDWALLTGDFEDTYNLRKKIVTNSLYGIDIMPGAVEICKLRLWLWLVSSLNEDQVLEPLPNIDFNIVQGNSLIGLIEEMNTFYDKGYYQQSLDSYSGVNYDFWTQRNKLIEAYKHTSGEKAQKMKNEIISFSEKFRLETDKKYYKELKSKGFKGKFDDLKSQDPVHILFQFSEVFENRGGFDVIIGNPPYYQTRSNESFTFTNSYKEIKESRLNIASVFVNRSLKLLGAQSILAMIVPKGFAYTGGWSKIRQKILKNYDLMNLIDCKRAFPGVKLEQLIFILQNRNNFQLKKSKVSIGKLKGEIISTSHKVDQTLCHSDDKFHLETEKISYDIKQKMEKTNISLSNLDVKIYRGLPNKYVATKKTKIAVPGLKGKDISPLSIRSYSELDQKIIENSNSSKFPEKNEIILLQRILAHVGSHIKITGVKNTEKIPTISTVSNIEIIDSKGYHVNYLLGLLHSSLINFYVHKFIYTNAIRSMDLDRYYLEQIPLPVVDEEDQKELINLIQETESYEGEVENYEQIQKEIDILIFEHFNIKKKEMEFIRDYTIS